MGNRTAGALGVIVAGFAVAQKLGNWENKPLATILLFVASIALVWWLWPPTKVGWKWLHRQNILTRRNVWKTVVCLSFVLAITLSIQVYLRPTVHKPFSPLYKQYFKVLGYPTTEAKKPHFSYMAMHEHALVAYFDDPLDLYVIRDNGKWDTKPRLSLPSTDDPLCTKDYPDAASRLFHRIPKDLQAPFCVVALAWLADSDWWERIGWRKFHCGFDQGIFLQTFANGEIIGPFRSRKDQNHGMDVVLFKDGTWKNHLEYNVGCPIVPGTE
jgi:hypothetical protein